MIYLLDSSVLIDLLHHKQSAFFFIKSHAQDTMITSVLCAFEVSCGVERSHVNSMERHRNEYKELLISLSGVVSCTAEDAGIAAKIHADLTRKGNKIDDLDMLIAATALRLGATVVTYNPRHFERIKELTVKTPESA